MKTFIRVLHLAFWVLVGLLLGKLAEILLNLLLVAVFIYFASIYMTHEASDEDD